MSRGPGRIERAITNILDAEPDNAFTTEDLAERVYGVTQVDKKHRVAVLRAARRLMHRRDTLREFTGRNLGMTAVFFTCTSVMSYAMARLKADLNYRDKNRRLGQWAITNEQDLRNRLTGIDSRGNYAQYVAPDGAWRKHVQSWIAEIDARREGDAKKLEQVLRKRHDEDNALRRMLGFSLG